MKWRRRPMTRTPVVLEQEALVRAEQVLAELALLELVPPALAELALLELVPPAPAEQEPRGPEPRAQVARAPASSDRAVRQHSNLIQQGKRRPEWSSASPCCISICGQKLAGFILWP